MAPAQVRRKVVNAGIATPRAVVQALPYTGSPMDGQLHVPKRLTARPPKGHTLAPMAHRYLSFCVFALVAMLAAPSIAQAQYKNKSFGMDVSYQLISQPPITDSNNN